MKDTLSIQFSPERLRSARGDRRPEELAVAAGVSAQSIRNWESGAFEPGATALARIAAFLDRPISHFFVDGRRTAA